MKKYSVIVIGAGNRGSAYVSHMKKLPEKYEVVGVADPVPERREHIRRMFGLSESVCYSDCFDILAQPKMADIAIIATMDDSHYEPALRAIEKGYHLLLEKPVAQTAQECIDIANAARKKGVKVLVGHVLRYAPFFQTIKKMVMDGAVGRVMSVLQVEGVGHIHQSHSYVRGSWHREEETTPMLLAKCCHDLDIIQWLIDRPCTKVSSFGSLSHFTPENAPKNAPERCFEQACPASDTCPYQSERVYKQAPIWMRLAAGKGYGTDIIPSDEEINESLRHTNYGACVYRAGNDVVDHQVVNMEFEDGATASLIMNAFNKGGRYIRIFGTKGEIYAHVGAQEITYYSLITAEQKNIPLEEVNETQGGGHGGGDAGLIRELYEYLNDSYEGYCAADIDISVQNHLIGFAAEQARHNDTVENVIAFGEKLGFTLKK